MSYVIPLRFINLSDKVAVCATRIVTIMSVDIKKVRAKLVEERKKGTLINCCGFQQAAKSVAILDNGTMFASPYRVQTLLNRISSSNDSDSYIRKSKQRLRAYDVLVEAPKPGQEEEADVISGYYGEEEDEEEVNEKEEEEEVVIEDADGEELEEDSEDEDWIDKIMNEQEGES